MIDINKWKSKFNISLNTIPKIFQAVLNGSLVLLAIILSYLLLKELLIISHVLIGNETSKDHLFLANILVFFLYFEFISMIVKYFKEDYHFPLRYFIYIGITAMIRLIIVDHTKAIDTLLYALVILVLIIGYFIMNITPRERSDSKWLFKK